MLNYVIQPTHIAEPGSQCFYPHITECPAEQLRALELFQNANYQITMVQVLDLLGVHLAKRRCVAMLLRRVQRMLYLPEPTLRWLLVVNQAKIPLTVKEFTELFRGSQEATKTNAKISFPVFLYRQPDKFDSRRCDLHRWYTDFLIRFAGRSVAEMNLRVVPMQYVSLEASKKVNEIIISPPLDIVNQIIAIEKVRVREGHPRNPRVKQYSGTRKEELDDGSDDLENESDQNDQNAPQHDNSNNP